MKILQLSMVAMGLGLMAGVAKAEWGQGLGYENKSIYIPENQQSGWPVQVTPVKKKTDRKVVEIQEPMQAQEAPAEATQAAAITEKEWNLGDVQFETGSDQIKPESQATLDKTAEVLKKNEQVVVEIQGFSDNVGSPNINQDLSEKRAMAVKLYLAKQGVEAQRLEAKGYGETNPVYDNSTPDGRAKNRRIQFKVLSQ